MGRERPLVHIPTPIVSRVLRLLDPAIGENTPITWDEAELLEANMVARRDSSGVATLGLNAQPLRAVLGSHPNL
jgi:hypothetical protein